MTFEDIKHRRRWFQFSLGTFMLLIVGCSLFLAMLGRQVRHSEQEFGNRQQTNQELAEIGGRATGWSHKTGASRIVFEGTNFDASALEQLQQALTRNPNITAVLLYDTVGTDGALAALAELDSLEEVHMQRADVTDEGLNMIAAIPSIRQLFAKDKWIKLEGTPSLQASSADQR
jgi:hypothetical protein